MNNVKSCVRKIENPHERNQTKMSETKQISGAWPLIKRFVPLGVLVIAITAFFKSGLHRHLSFDSIAVNYGQLAEYVMAHPVLASLALVAAYAIAVALSFPAAWLLTVTAGLIFGWLWGGALVVFGATIGACILFLAARYALGDYFRQKAGGLVAKMAEGFRNDAVSYMFFLRFTPLPFTLVNAVPGILGVKLSTFAWTTFVGIIPGVIAYSYAGEGLRSIVAERAEACGIGEPPCGTALSPGDLVTKEILIAFALLAVVSLIPVVLKRLRRKSTK